MKTLLLCVLLLSGCAKKGGGTPGVAYAASPTHAPTVSSPIAGLYKYEDEDAICYVSDGHGISCVPKKK